MDAAIMSVTLIHLQHNSFRIPKRTFGIGAYLLGLIQKDCLIVKGFINDYHTFNSYLCLFV